MDPRLAKLLDDASRNVGASLDDPCFATMMDESDPVGHLRSQFHYPKMKDLPPNTHVDLSLVNAEDDCIYLCGNSLGLCPKGTRELVCKEIDKWSKWGVYGHTLGEIPWAEADLRVDEQTAKLVGAANREEVTIMNGLTVNIHVLLTTFYEPTAERHKILLESKAFPADHYAVESQIRLHGCDPADSMVCVEPREGEQTLRDEDILRVIEEQGDSIAVCFFSGVHYYTGQVFDMKGITEAAHKKGILVGFDLAHAIGNIPLELHNWDVDFACWCSYKYLCSGAGGIAGAFIHSKLDETFKPKLHGWWGHNHNTRFNMDNNMDLIPGAQGYRLTNPSGLLCASLKASLNVFDMVSVHDLRAKSLKLTGYLEYLIRKNFSKLNEADNKKVSVDIFTPVELEKRGCQLSLTFSVPITEIFHQLTKRGVVCDERKPSVIRIAPVHLYNSYSDVYRFILTLKEVIDVVSR